MFELYKKRDLSANFSDTTMFFKMYGKHYFKNYFTINGILLMIVVILFYFISKVYMELLSSGLTNFKNNSNYLMDYFNNNIFLVVGSFILVVVLALVLSILSLSFPVVYLQLFEKKNSINFSTKDILTSLKAISGKMLGFVAGSVFVILPLSLIVFGLLILLCFILVGIPLIFIAGIAFFSWIYLSYYDYILKNTSFFSALANGFRLMKQNFWSTIGTTFLMLLILQIFQGCITLIPNVISMIWMATVVEESKQVSAASETFSTMGIVFSTVMVLSVLLSYTLNNVSMINQGLIYYSLQEEKENIATTSQIDLIGTDIE